MKPIICLLLTAIYLSSEVRSQKAELGIHIGSSFSNYKSTLQSVSMTSKTRMGYVVGLVSHIKMGKIISFQPALNYVQKGGKLKSHGFRDDLILHYLEIPLNLAFAFPVRDSKVMIGGGPALSFGMYGTDEWEAQGQSGKETIKFGSGSNNNFRTFEAGLNFMAGFISDDGFMVLLNYNTGLTDIMNSTDAPGGEFRTRYFGLKIGQMLFRR